MKRTDRDIFLYMELSAEGFKTSSFELITAGQRIAAKTGGRLIAVVISETDQVAKQLDHYGLDCVICVCHESLGKYSTFQYTKALYDLIIECKPDVMLFSATKTGKDLAPRLARRLGTGITANCIDLESNPETGIVSWNMPAPGGIMATILCSDHRPQLGTICPGIFEKPVQKVIQNTEFIYKRIDPGEREHIKMISSQNSEGQGNNQLLDAEIVVAGGRGMGSKESFQLIIDLASRLGAAVGASRAAVDNGYADPQYLIGQTGTIVKPKLYIACGISGALQHIIGAEKADCIIAINRDREAPIMSYADYAIIGDVRDVLPKLINNLSQI